MASAIAELDAADVGLLTSMNRPVVLVRRLPSARLAPAVAPGSADIGIMIAYTAVHHLLLGLPGMRLVRTSSS